MKFLFRRMAPVLLLAVPGPAAAAQAMACSADVGQATINELKSKGGGSGNLEFVEFKVLQDNVDITGWQICGSFGGNKDPCADVGVGNGTWRTLAQPAGLPDDSQSVYDTNTWITYVLPQLKAEEGEVILFDEFGNVIDYIRWSSQDGICTSSAFEWDVPGACGSCFDERDPDQKDFARGPDGTGDWGNNGDEPSEGTTNDPEPPAADHFALIHDGSAINCQAEPVTIVAHDSLHAVVTGYVSQVALGTSTVNGEWTGIAAGAGTLTNNGGGSATYQFVAGDNGQATLLLHDSFVETLNINVSDGMAVEAFAEDPDLAYASSGFAFRVNGAPGVLPQQIAGKPSDAGHNAVLLELEAINTNDDTGACEAFLAGPVDIGFAVECDEPATCAANAMTVNGVGVPGYPDGGVAGYQPVTLDFGDTTDTTATLVTNYADAGGITLHAVLDPGWVSAQQLAGATSFSVRPFGFHLAAENGSEATVNPGATGAAGGVFAKAGAAFDVAVRAVAWELADDIDANGIPDGHDNADPADNADLSDNAVTPSFGNEGVAATAALTGQLVLPAGGNDPALAGATTVTGFAAGAARSNPVWFDEVGVFEILATLGSGAYLGGENVIGASGHVGRFIPARFDVTVPADGCTDAGGFTYSGQPIGLVEVTAVSANGFVTANYDGPAGFARDVALGEVSGIAGALSETAIAATLFDTGTAALSTLAFTFTAAETPYSDIAIRATDTDGVTSAGAVEEGTEIRSGRFLIGAGNAPTISDGDVPVAVETWQESTPGTHEWMIHADDLNCTSPVSADFTLAFPDPALAAGETDIVGINWNAGSGELVFSAPGAGNAGNVDVTGSVENWLRFDWNGSGVQSAAGVMHFREVFSTEDGFIDRREIVQ